MLLLLPLLLPIAQACVARDEAADDLLAPSDPPRGSTLEALTTAANVCVDRKVFNNNNNNNNNNHNGRHGGHLGDTLFLTARTGRGTFNPFGKSSGASSSGLANLVNLVLMGLRPRPPKDSNLTFCREDVAAYECLNHEVIGGREKTEVVTYACCPRFRMTGVDGWVGCVQA